MGVHEAAPLTRWGLLQQVPSVNQNVPDVCVLGGAHLTGHGACGFKALVTIAFAQTESPQASSVGVLGVTLALQHQLDSLGTGQTNALTPQDQPLGRPLRMRLVAAFWQVLGYGGESPFVRATHVAGHALASVQHLYRVSRHAQLQYLPDQGVGGAVAVNFKLDVAVHMHPHGLEDGPLPGLGGLPHQSRGFFTHSLK